MTTHLKAGLAALLILTSGAAGAGDLPSSKLLPPAPALPSFYSWTGFYVGAQIGYSWDTDKTRQIFATGRSAEFRYNPEGLVGGGQAGFNYQIGAIVLGVEGDVEALRARGGFNDPASFGRSQRDWQASLRGRIGYAFDTLMFYGTGGAAFTEFDYRFLDPATGLSAARQASKTGWTVGAGVNYALTSNLILGAEYRYTDYGKFDHAGAGALPGLSGQQDPKMHTARASIAYKF